MTTRLKAAPLSDSEDDDSDNHLVEKRLKVMRELSELESEQQDRFTGGIIISSESKSDKYANATSQSAAEKKGQKEVEELERELDLKNTFSKETNRRDEDAEMNKYIEEQLRLRREATKKEHQRITEADKRSENPDDDESNLPKLSATSTDNVDDILLQTLSKHMASSADEKSEAMLSNQMLSGIPEVNLGIDEKIRTIESTEEAKLRLASGPSKSKKPSSVAPKNYSSNFHQHRSSSAQSGRDHRPKVGSSDTKVMTEAVVSIGEEPKEVEYRLQANNRERPPPKGKASDDYYLSKFKKTMRR